MRILALTDFYPPVIGGSERHIQALSRELVRRGHQVTVATLSGGWDAGQDDEGVTIERLAGINRLLGPFYERADRPFHPPMPDLGVMTQLMRLVRAVAPDVVTAQGWSMYSYLPLRRRLGIPVVVTLHDYGLACVKKSLLRGGEVCTGPAPAKCIACAGDHYGRVKGTGLTLALMASSRLHGNVDRYVAVSTAVADALRGATAGVSIEVIPSFVADDALAVADHAPRPAFVPAGPYVLCVGSWGSHKGLDVLLEAQRRLNRTQPTPLVILAAGETPPGDAHLPDGVTLVTNAAHSDVMGACAHATVSVVPSVWLEPFGQVAVEAMAAGRPVVASRIGGLTDILMPDVGVMVEPGDAAELAAAIGALLADPARRSALGAAGRSRAKLFTASHVAGRMESLLEDVVREARR